MRLPTRRASEISSVDACLNRLPPLSCWEALESQREGFGKAIDGLLLA